jgi:hypothetical protein
MPVPKKCDVCGKEDILFEAPKTMVEAKFKLYLLDRRKYAWLCRECLHELYNTHK